MPAANRRDEAGRLMASFLQRTASGPRYLWTDAYAVGNLLWLGQVEAADRLIAAVHHTLGRHRPDGPCQGWLSGLSEQEGERHPTAGGLRIGKPLPERSPDDPFDENLEWERDGQYFHYLTRWMMALEKAGGSAYLGWAEELARVAHRRFGYRQRGVFRMVWKMSVDLSRPLVPSMGHHDPLDGLVTALVLQARGADLAVPIADYRSVVEAQDLATGDPLGMGGMLDSAARLHSLGQEEDLCHRLLRATNQGLRYYRARTRLSEPAEGRLGFRELGLAIGLGLARRAGLEVHGEPELELGILGYWSHPPHRTVASWTGHRDINEVMLATALLLAGA